MVLYQAQTQFYKALMHPTRLAILDMLRDEEQCVCHMEAVIGQRQAHISQHLMLLRDAGLVSDRRDGWNIFYRVIRPEIYEVLDSMNALCGESPGNLLALEIRAHKEACPCPKCHESEAPTSLEKPALKNVEVG
jgi:DNA-binding transcriptional ArsR family regulator